MHNLNNFTCKLAKSVRGYLQIQQYKIKRDSKHVISLIDVSDSTQPIAIDVLMEISNDTPQRTPPSHEPTCDSIHCLMFCIIVVPTVVTILMVYSQ